MKTTFKTLSTLLLLIIAISAISCNKDKNGKDDDTGKTGKFTIDGVEYSGNSEEQTFVNDNYSIVCQQDEPFKLIQITFHNKAEAITGGTFDVADFSLNVPSGSVEVGVDGLTFDPDGAKTIVVAGNKISISNLPLIQTGGGSKHPLINSASINF
ncbi:MAG TPA: hypothetical protein PLC61_10650 [Chitinophagales bacterium]|nr:hypothetical protein [Chitinophagales bacterium]MCB9075298.1 hypothetical protein [Chitinophagales bacterium]HMU97254.1 hypothetical protein [Chitinophagales bacterium]HMV02057.1 hypothetical protein [Chitinophagales bacterium]HMW93771.1 hypothetical protein [Chitinophagales bacterium]